MDGQLLAKRRAPRPAILITALLMATGVAQSALADQLEIPPALIIGSTVAGAGSGTISEPSPPTPTAAQMPRANVVHGLPISLKRPLKRTSPVIDVIPEVPEGNIIRPRRPAPAQPVDSTRVDTQAEQPALSPTPDINTLPQTVSDDDTVPNPEPPRPTATEATRTVQDNPMLTIASRALEKIPGGVREKVVYARSVANAGDLDGARAMCQALMNDSAGEPENVALARGCLQFDVPLVKLRQLMKESRMTEANQLVAQMLGWVGNIPEYRDYLLSIREITARRAASEDPKAREQTILGVVQGILEQYREQQGRFPLSYDELNGALPADTPPLTEYDIVSYYATEDAFSVKLKARANPLEVLSLHKTGLIK